MFICLIIINKYFSWDIIEKIYNYINRLSLLLDGPDKNLNKLRYSINLIFH